MKEERKIWGRKRGRGGGEERKKRDGKKQRWNTRIETRQEGGREGGKPRRKINERAEKAKTGKKGAQPGGARRCSCRCHATAAMLAACNVIMVAADEYRPFFLQENWMHRRKREPQTAKGTCVRPSARAQTTLAKPSPKACRCNLQSSGWSDHLRPVRASPWVPLSAPSPQLFPPATFLRAVVPPSFRISFRGCAILVLRTANRIFFQGNALIRGMRQLMIGLERRPWMGIRFFGRDVLGASSSLGGAGRVLPRIPSRLVFGYCILADHLFSYGNEQRGTTYLWEIGTLCLCMWHLFMYKVGRSKIKILNIQDGLKVNGTWTKYRILNRLDENLCYDSMLW